MTDQASEALKRLDDRLEALHQALAQEDWQRLAELNNGVPELVDPVMDALEQRRLSAGAVQQRLRALDQFVSQADEAARRARAEAKEALAQVGQNRKAASAYARVSDRKR